MNTSRISLSIAIIACLAAPLLHAQNTTRAVSADGNGTITWPTGNLTTPGNLTAGNITSNGTITGATLAGNLSAANLTGTVADARLSGNVVTTTAANTTMAGNLTITSNGTLTSVTTNLTGSISTYGNFITNSYWKNTAGSIVTVIDGNGGAGVNLYDLGDVKTTFVFVAGNTYLDYTGNMYFRNGYGGTSSLVLPDASGVQIGSSGTAMQSIYSSSAIIDFASTDAQTTNSGNTITVTGVTTTNTPNVSIGLSGALPTGCSVHGIVTGNNTITLYFVNSSASAQDPGAVTIRATATQF